MTDDNKPKPQGTRVIQDPGKVAAKHAASQGVPVPSPTPGLPPSRGAADTSPKPKQPLAADDARVSLSKHQFRAQKTVNFGINDVDLTMPERPVAKIPRTHPNEPSMPSLGQPRTMAANPQNLGRRHRSGHNPLSANDFARFANEIAVAPGNKSHTARATIRPPESEQGLANLVPLLPALPLLRTKAESAHPIDLNLQQTLGTGGMGVVLLAKQFPLDREVAVKTLRKNLDEESLQALLHEAMVAGYLEHPNVIPIHTVGKDENGSPLIVMKRVEGVTWLDVIEDPLAAPGTGDVIIDLDWHLDILLNICNAVGFAHSREIVHRDIKPENVMLGRFGEVYLLDWGVAISYSEGSRPPFLFHTREAKGLAGTPAYMAPEMCESEPIHTDNRSDIFLLGAILHHLLTGEPPNGNGGIAAALVRAFNCDPPHYPPTVSPELAAIARRSMAKNPSERFSSVEEFREAVVQYKEHRSSIAMGQEATRRIKTVESKIAGHKSSEEGDIARQLTEARFILQQSLSQWPENPQAQKLQEQLARVSFEYYLNVQNLGAAGVALQDMGAKNASMHTPRLEQARSHAHEQRDEIAALRHELDPRISLQQRLFVAVAISILWTCLAIYKAWSRWGVPVEEVEPNYLVSLIPTIVFPAILIAAARKMFASNLFNRRIYWFLLGGLSSVALVRIAGWAYDAPAHVTTGTEFILYALLAYVFGVIMNNKRAMMAPILLVVAALFAMAFPMYQYAFMAVAFMIFAPIIAYVWTTDSKI